MTACKRGDVVLVKVPKEDGVRGVLRPAVVLHPGDPTDAGVGLLPLVPEAAAGDRAIEIVRGSFEAARMGLVSSLSIDPDMAFDYPRALVAKVIGRCPYVLLDEVLRRRRSPLASVTRYVGDEDSRKPLPLQDESEGESQGKLLAMPNRDLPVALTADVDAEAMASQPRTTSLKEDVWATAHRAAHTSGAIRHITATTKRVGHHLAGTSDLPSASRGSEINQRSGLLSSAKTGNDEDCVDYHRHFRQEQARYTCLRTPEPIEINGDLRKTVWLAAPTSDAFVDIVHGGPAWFDTRVRLLWDDQYLYFGFTAEETDVWGTLTERDSKIYEENDLEIFIAGKDAYYEFEISACNVIYEVFWIWKDVHHTGGPYWTMPEFNPAMHRTMTLDGVGGHVHPRGERWGFLDWDLPGLKHAVKVDGTLNKRDDTDFGWSAEIAIPWQSLALLADGRSIPPEPGDVWRIDCSRFQKIGEQGEELDPCAGWTWNRHGHYDSHIPEVFPFVTFSDELVKPG